MLNWIFFNVLLPLLGIVLIWAGLAAIGSPKKLSAIVRDGQLCFFSTALCAGALHDFIPINKNYHDVVIGILLTLIIVFDFFYGLAAVAEKISTINAEAFQRNMFIISACSVAGCTAIIVIVRTYWGMWGPL